MATDNYSVNIKQNLPDNACIHDYEIDICHLIPISIYTCFYDCEIDMCHPMPESSNSNWSFIKTFQSELYQLIKY